MRTFYYVLCSKILLLECVVIFVTIHSIRNDSLSTDCLSSENIKTLSGLISAGKTWHISFYVHSSRSEGLHINHDSMLRMYSYFIVNVFSNFVPLRCNI